MFILQPFEQTLCIRSHEKKTQRTENVTSPQLHRKKQAQTGTSFPPKPPPSGGWSQCHQVDLEWALRPPLTMPVQPPCLHRPWGSRHVNHIYGMAVQPNAPQKALMEHIVTRTSLQSCVCTPSGLREAYVQSMLKNLKNNTENKQALNVCDISNEATDWV